MLFPIFLLFRILGTELIQRASCALWLRERCGAYAANVSARRCKQSFFAVSNFLFLSSTELGYGYTWFESTRVRTHGCARARSRTSDTCTLLTLFTDYTTLRLLCTCACRPYILHIYAENHILLLLTVHYTITVVIIHTRPVYTLSFCTLACNALFAMLRRYLVCACVRLCSQ